MIDEKSETSEVVPPAPTTESSAFGVSVRGWVTLLIVGTVCTMGLMQMAVGEPLKGGFIFCIGFYFGQKAKS